MSNLGDIFGASPKSVLNKPFMHVQHTVTANHSLTSGTRTCTLDSIIINEISGASLSSSQITLPAGTYWIEGSGLVRSVEANPGTITLKDSSDNVLLNGSTSAGDDHHEFVDGRITLASSTVIKLVAEQIHTTGTIDTGDPSTPVVVNALKIWKLDSTFETPVVGDASMVLARPLMHVQERYSQNTGTSTPTQNSNIRLLNSIQTNEISGASLSSYAVSLPAGTYEVRGFTSVKNANLTARCNILDASDSSVLLAGLSTRLYGASEPEVSGRLVLTEATSIYLEVYLSPYQNEAGTLGRAVNQTGVDEIYADLKIYQIDAWRQTPVLVNDTLYPLPGSTYVTGNMHGLEYSYLTANSITVNAGICMDSTNNTVLSASSSQTVAIGTTINEVYNLFLCDDGVVRTDTDVDGATISGTYGPLRWIGYVLTDSSGDIIDFTMSGDKMQYPDPTEVTLGSSFTTSWTSHSMGNFVPLGRIIECDLGIDPVTDGDFAVSLDAGTSIASTLDNGNQGVYLFGSFPIQSTYHFKCISADTATAVLHGVRLKR